MTLIIVMRILRLIRGNGLPLRYRPMSLRLAYREHGAGPPVMILHGLFGSGTNWGSLARRLANVFQVFTPDLRNHGDSPHATGMDYRALAGDVTALMDELSIDSARFIGHSMGGKTAMMLALSEPNRVERLCVVDIAPVDYGHDYDEILTAMRGIDLDRIGSREQADAALAVSVAEPALRAFLLQNLRQREGRWHWRIGLEQLRDEIDTITGWPLLPPGVVYPGPTLFVGGECSGYLGSGYEETIRGRFPRAVITRIGGAGHWVHVEAPRAFAETVDDFLRGSG
jgi:pimeloyl-ACP methyl ester carboxylesterase